MAFEDGRTDRLLQIDCVVQGVKPQGVFCEAGPLAVFVSKMVRDSRNHGWKITY